MKLVYRNIIFDVKIIYDLCNVYLTAVGYIEIE